MITHSIVVQGCNAVYVQYRFINFTGSDSTFPRAEFSPLSYTKHARNNLPHTSQPQLFLHQQPRLQQQKLVHSATLSHHCVCWCQGSGSTHTCVLPQGSAQIKWLWQWYATDVTGMLQGIRLAETGDITHDSCKNVN